MSKSSDTEYNTGDIYKLTPWHRMLQTYSAWCDVQNAECQLPMANYGCSCAAFEIPVCCRSYWDFNL